MKENCRTCRFYSGGFDNESGICRRFPPQAFMPGGYDGVDTIWKFPEVAASSWCGEWSPAVTDRNLLTEHPVPDSEINRRN